MIVYLSLAPFAWVSHFVNLYPAGPVNYLLIITQTAVFPVWFSDLVLDIMSV